MTWWKEAILWIGSYVWDLYRAGSNNEQNSNEYSFYQQDNYYISLFPNSGLIYGYILGRIIAKYESRNVPSSQPINNNNNESDDEDDDEFLWDNLVKIKAKNTNLTKQSYEDFKQIAEQRILAYQFRGIYRGRGVHFSRSKKRISITIPNEEIDEGLKQLVHELWKDFQEQNQPERLQARTF